MRSTLVRSRTQQINCVRGFCGASGLLTSRGDPATFAKRVRELGPAMEFVEVVLEGIEHLSGQIAICDKLIAKIVKGSEVCQRLMTVPGVGPITALSVMSSLDEIRTLRRRACGRILSGPQSWRNSELASGAQDLDYRAGQVYARYALVQASKSARRCRPNDPMVKWSQTIEDRKRFADRDSCSGPEDGGDSLRHLARWNDLSTGRGGADARKGLTLGPSDRRQRLISLGCNDCPKAVTAPSAGSRS